jgi:hypothetical protein
MSTRQVQQTVSQEGKEKQNEYTRANQNDGQNGMDWRSSSIHHPHHSLDCTKVFPLINFSIN